MTRAIIDPTYTGPGGGWTPTRVEVTPGRDKLLAANYDPDTGVVTVIIEAGGMALSVGVPRDDLLVWCEAILAKHRAGG